MKSKEIIEDSLIYPFLDLKKTFTILILFLTSFLIFPTIMACGYLLQLIEKTTQGSKELWTYDTKRNLLLDGAKFLVMFIIFEIFLYGIGALETILNNFTLLNGLGTYLIEAVIIIAFNIIFIMSLANMAYEKRFISAFNFKKIFNLIRKVGIKKYTLLIVVFTLVAGFINEVWVDVMRAFIGFGGIWANIGFILFSITISTYMLIFASRFTGLIYPEKPIRIVKK